MQQGSFCNGARCSGVSFCHVGLPRTDRLMASNEGGKMQRPWQHSGRGRLMAAAILVGTIAVLAALMTASAGAQRNATPKPPTAKQLHAAAAKLVAAARAEGTLNFYTSADQVTCQKLADAFGKKYGIKVTFTRLTSGPIAARYNAEAQA